MAEHFYKLRIAEIVAETDEANSIRFEVPEGLEDLFRFKAGQHLSVRAEIDGEEVRRNYSLCVAPSEDQLKVTVKLSSATVKSQNWCCSTMVISRGYCAFKWPGMRTVGLSVRKVM